MTTLPFRLSGCSVAILAKWQELHGAHFEKDSCYCLPVLVVGDHRRVRRHTLLCVGSAVRRVPAQTGLCCCARRGLPYYENAVVV